MKLITGNESYAQQITKLKAALDAADAVLVGAGAGLSASAGFDYSGARFRKYFSDLAATYGLTDMYSGGFVMMRYSPEAFWAFWSRNIYINRYMNPPKPVYDKLFELVRGKDYFVLTTNVDHCFQKAGFDKERLFYTQGDYGLWQCGTPCHQATYDNKETVVKMLKAQGFELDGDGNLSLPEGVVPTSTVPSGLVPGCPVCGEPMTMNLRCDHTFVEDDGWHRANDRYEAFVKRVKDKKILLLELGVGGNTPVIIKYPFWQLAAQNEQATYACVNLGESVCHEDISRRSICIDGDIGDCLNHLI